MPVRAQVFEYVSYQCDDGKNQVVFTYRLDERTFTESVRFPDGGDWEQPAIDPIVRLLFLVTGISYYKAGAPPTIDCSRFPLTATEHEFLRTYYLEGLGEYAYRNQLDLSDVSITAPDRFADPVDYTVPTGRPLVPFGGGLDSIVSVELLRGQVADPALFIVGRPEDRYAAIERPAAMVGWPIVRAERSLDPQVMRSAELGFFNGHIPVTAIISMISVLAAVLQGRDAVVMSNEWSASSATLEVNGRGVNHQYSKSYVFEGLLRGVIAEAITGNFEYFSLLRPLTELWIAREFARHPQYTHEFRSCNRAFHVDPARRLETWCGTCDKCSFIDLILSPYLDRDELATVFSHAEPLENPALVSAFRGLLGVDSGKKPWECVGDAAESRMALRLAAQRLDRAGNALLTQLVSEVAHFNDPDPRVYLKPLGDHYIPERYLPDAFVA